MDESPAVPVQNDTPPQPTWDNPTPEAPPAASAASEPAPAAATPPTTPLETTGDTPASTEQPQLDAEPAAQPDAEPAPARESAPEAPKDDFTPEADDPPEIAALPTPAAKRWAQRQFKEARPTRLFLDTDQPIQAFGDDLFERSPSRYWEHVDDLIAAHPDYITEKLKSKLQPQPATPTPSVTAQPAPSTPSALTEAELANLTDAQIVERFQQAQTTAAQQVREQLQKEFDDKFNELKTQFDAVSGKFNTHEQQAREQQVIALESELKTNVMKVVDEAVREWGLEPKGDDPPKLANLKRNALKIIKAEFEPTFDADDSNVKVIEKVREFARRLERANVFREEDNLKVRARAAAEKVKALPEMQVVMDEIAAYVEQSKAKPRATDPAPPVAGAAAGVTIAPPSSWDEAYSQAKAAEGARV